jgi:hypothetical protein
MTSLSSGSSYSSCGRLHRSTERYGSPYQVFDLDSAGLNYRARLIIDSSASGTRMLIQGNYLSLPSKNYPNRSGGIALAHQRIPNGGHASTVPPETHTNRSTQNVY